MRSAVADVLADLSRALDQIGAGRFLFGAQAALVYGSDRLTSDVDVTVDLRGKPTEALVEALTDAGFRMRVSGADFVRQTRVLPASHVASGMDVDLVLAGPGIEELFVERAEIRDLDGVLFPVACAEDIVAMKILAGRPKDIDDVIAILKARAAGFRLELARATLEMLEGALDRSDLLPELTRAFEMAERGRVPGRRKRRMKK